MAASPLTPGNPLDPPLKLLQRSAQVGNGVPNTLRVPGDPLVDEPQRWYRTGGNMPTLRAKNNLVKFTIDGQETFKEMVAVMRTATGAGHFIYFLNWWVDDGFNLPSDPPSQTLLKLIKAADKKKVLIRGMFWDQVGTQNTSVVKDFNALATGAAILDNRTMNFGSQHQKVLCVLGEQGLVTFCGGIDFNQDRIFTMDQLHSGGGSGSSGGKGAPLHDVHTRITGPAAVDVLQVFTQRWMDHPDSADINKPASQGGKGPLIFNSQIPSSKGPQYVQIGRTYGRGVGYNFAPNGETTAREIILQGIRSARRFIYTEDQYFVGNPEVEAALVSVLRQKQIQHLTICITHWRISDLPTIQKHRRAFLNNLVSAGGSRVRVFTLQPPGVDDATLEAGHVAHTYIHAKMWIMDDEFASIGTVNTNNRSWTHDSEITAGVYDTSNDTILTYHMAHWLRIKVWAEHLGMQTPEGEAELADGVASGAIWLHPPATARIRPYNINDSGDIHLPFPASLIEDSIYPSVADPA